MPRIVEKQEFDLLEPGLYQAELIDYTDTRDDGTPLMSNARFGDPKPQWKFKFELLDYPEPDRQISAWVNKPRDLDSIAQNSNLSSLATALLGVAIEDEWKLEDLLHKRCRVQIEWFKKQDGTDGAKIGKFYRPADARVARQAVAAGPTRRASAAPVEQEDIPF